MCMPQHMWKSEENLQRLDLPFHGVGCGDYIQVFSIGGCFPQMSYLAGHTHSADFFMVLWT